MLRYASLVLVLATHVLHAQQQPVRPAPAAAERTIRGRVTAASNGAALPRVRVAVPSAQGQWMRAVLSDDRGRFALVVPSATRTITASKAGYAAVATAAPQDAEDIEVRLEAGSAVSGRVTDPGGVPVALVRVTVRRDIPGRDTGAVAAAFETTTDDLGEYRAGGLAAGRYAVTVALPRPAAPGAGSPATANVSQAIDLRAGEEAGVSLVIAPPVTNIDPFDEFAAATQAALAQLRSGSGGALPNGRLLPMGDATLRGRVLAEQGEPLAGAIVTVHRAGLQVRATMTDASGEYVMIGLPPGEVIVEAAKAGYVTAQHGQGRISRLGSPVALGARTSAANIDVILPRGSVITGIVMDEDGEVLAGAEVEALQLQTNDGRPVAQRAGVTRRTDDYGRYRLFGLMPGRYLVRAAIDDVMTGEDGRPIAEGYAPVYYPAAIRADDGSAVTVEAGRDVAGLNLVFTRAAVSRVRGRVVNASGRPLSATVVLAVSHRSGGVALAVREASTAADGSFEIANVPPGDYVVQALAAAASDDDDPPGAPASALLPEFGREMVSVREADPALITIQTSPPASISGRVVLEGRPGSYAARMEVRAVPADRDDSPVNAGPRVAVVRSDRTFVLDGVTGRVRLQLGHDADAWYVRSIVVGGHDVTRQPFDAGLQGGVFSNATIFVSAAGAEISGQVVDEQDQRADDAAVVVFSTGRDGWYGGSERVRFTRPDRRGVFRLAGLPPGSYWVAAVDTLEGSVEAGDWTSAALLQQLAGVGRRVTVGEGAIHTGRFRIARR
jgi:protocatechuate 3,4-dioxygenase beta subunit